VHRVRQGCHKGAPGGSTVDRGRGSAGMLLDVRGLGFVGDRRHGNDGGGEEFRATMALGRGEGQSRHNLSSIVGGKEG